MQENQKVTLAIVIVNFRTPQFIVNCLETLLPELLKLDAKVVVVDNNSQDNSSFIIGDWLSKNDSEKTVFFFQSNNNNGFASGNNLGIKLLEAKYYLLLNSDTIIRKGSINTLLNTAEQYPKMGIISPGLEWPDGKTQESCFRFKTPVTEFLNGAQTGILDNIFKSHVAAMPVQKEMLNPDWTSFACVLIRKEVFAEIGLLDEGYFMYFEDLEFCWRAKKAGWQVVHNPASRVVHLRGGSSPVKERTKLKKRLPLYFYESRTRFYYQCYGWFGLVAANFLWWSGRIISKLRQIFGRKDKASIERQWLDIWCNCLSPLKHYTHPDNYR